MHACFYLSIVGMYVYINVLLLYVCFMHAYIYICKYILTVQRNLLPQLTFLITETLVFSETPLQTYQAALRHSPED
jgi:hypothetical protein